ncbi:MAG: EamA family transporter [Deltaproteobacteria bacterium]|nr:EamA family transporter [Deltaproteobacteria bacterium]
MKPSGPRALGDSARGAVFGLCAAATFGLSAPVAKLLLTEVSPVLLAGLLYLGAAAGLWLHRAVRPASSEARLVRADVPKLAGVVLAGGILAPVLMLFGLERVTGLSGSLLLNLEAPFTVLLAVLLFREHLGRHAALAALFIFAGAGVLKLESGALGADTAGVLLLAAACLCWALDNNLTQRLTLRDPFAIVRVKTLMAGGTNVTLGLLIAGGAWPDVRYVGGAMLLGSVSYGLSIVLDAYALRFIGAAREAAYFATAPFVGALLSVVILGDHLRWDTLLAMLSMVLGVVLLLRERHAHLHTHEVLEHEHLHEHDVHHQHEHAPDDPVGSPHSHWHRHDALVHDHPHVPDVHHRHPH